MLWLIVAFILGVLVGWSVAEPTWIKGLLVIVVTKIVSLFHQTGS